MKHKPLEGQVSLLDILFTEIPAHPAIEPAIETVIEASDASPAVLKKPDKSRKMKILAPLPLVNNPAVMLHKGGGKIVITPEDTLAYLRLMEIRGLNKDHLTLKDSSGAIVGEITVLPGIDLDKWSLSARAWSLIGTKFDKHPIVRMLKSYGLEVKVSQTLGNWLKKEERRIKRENTPLLLPEYKDTRTLFDKVEAGMVLHCKKSFEIDGPGPKANKILIFEKGQRYQVVDTARGGTDGTDGIVKIFKNPIAPGVRIVLTGPDVFEWTTFHGPMEEVFDYEERVIYDPDKCVPAVYPELYKYFESKLKAANPELFDHTMVDLPQMATKRDVADLKLMRMGKFQPIDSKILTPDGWKLMGGIEVGDLVFGSDGKPYPVSAVFPQGEKPVFRVVFTDGSSTECGMSHLWQVNTPERKMSGRSPKVLALKEIAKKMRDRAGNTRYYIPIAKPFEFPEKDLPLDPYLLGCLLGDARLGTGKKGYGTPCLTSADEDLILTIAPLLPEGIRPHRQGKYGYELTNPDSQGGQRNKLIVILEQLGLRHGSAGKFIPDVYKFSSVGQRRRLLAGLLDTDGGNSPARSENSASSNEYTSISERLCDDVQFLIESLGGNAVKSSRIPTYTHKGKKLSGQRAYRLRFSFGPGTNPFMLKRKADTYKSCVKFPPTRGIVSIEPIGSKPCQCITVDSPDGLYTTDRCILTHNTREAAALIWLWGSKKCAWIGPRNARIFTVEELKTLAKNVPEFGQYVVVDKLEDLKKKATFYLLTYSWVKKQDDPNRQLRRQGKSWLRFTYADKHKGVLNEHKCPHCGSTLVWPYISKTYSDDIITGKKTLLLKGSLGWKKQPVLGREKEGNYGYVCMNPNCKKTYDNRKCKGAAWHTKKPIVSTGFDIIARDAHGEPIMGPDGKPTTKHLNYWSDINLKVHRQCKEKHIKGRICTNCGQADGVWVPPMYRRIKDMFSSVVVDEIHTIKSADSDVGKATRTFRGKHHVGLTGTLIPNTPSDSYWPLHWNFHGGSASFPYQGPDGATQYYDQFCEYVICKRGGSMKDSRKMLPYLKNPIQFWELMAPKMVRRSYEDPLVLSSLKKLGLFIPEPKMHRVASHLHPTQAGLMVASINHFETQFNQLANEAAQHHHLVNPALVISQMSRMRIAATCPEHFNAALAKMKPPRPPIYTGPLGGGKMADIKSLVSQRTTNGQKVVVLSGFIIMRQSLATELALYNPIVFDQSWDDEERLDAFKTFKDDPERQVWIAGTLEIKEGVDLSAANTVICTDLLWQPGLQAQAWSRVLTPTKEERKVDVYLLVAENTVDEHIYNTFYAKVAAAEQALDRKVINARASAVDIKWFVSRILEDRGKILDRVGREAGEELILVPDTSFLAFEERDL